MLIDPDVVLLAGFRFHQGHARCYCSVSIRISPIANIDHQNKESNAMMFADLVDQVDFLQVYLSEVCR